MSNGSAMDWSGVNDGHKAGESHARFNCTPAPAHCEFSRKMKQLKCSAARTFACCPQQAKNQFE